MDSFLPKHRGTRILTCGTGAQVVKCYYYYIYDYQIGHGERETTLKPRKIDTLPNDVVFVQVCAGGVHTMILADDGRIWSCGFNDKGTVPTKHAQKDEAVNEMDLIEIPHSLHRHGKVVLLAAGSSFSAALTEKGSVIVWGNFRVSLIFGRLQQRIENFAGSIWIYRSARYSSTNATTSNLTHIT
jgi:regulator of chromosome condensation